jgi:micrococcal nuclease
MLKRKTICLSAIMVLFLVVSGLADTFSGRVVAVTDGDTIKVMHQGRAERVRLQGIDCPEKQQAFGKRAKQFTADMVMGKEVTVIAEKADRYGRTLGYVILANNRNLNRELVQAAKRCLWQDQQPVPPWEFRRTGR